MILIQIFIGFLAKLSPQPSALPRLPLRKPNLYAYEISRNYESKESPIHGSASVSPYYPSHPCSIHGHSCDPSVASEQSSSATGLYNQNFSILFWASSTRCIRSNILPTDWGEPPRIFSAPIVTKIPACDLRLPALRGSTSSLTFSG